MGRERFGLHVRRAAVEAWVLAGRPAQGQMAPALAEFRKLMKERHANERLPRNVSEFVSGWVKAWEERGTVRSKSPSPRRSHLPDDVVDDCYHALLAGYHTGRRQCYFRSFRQAVQRCTMLRDVMARYTHDDGRPLKPASLWRRMKERHPGLSRRLLRFVRKRKSAERQQRVAYCSKLLAMPAAARQRYLARVVWLDAKKLYIVPTSQLVYAPKGADLVVEDRRVPDSWRAAKKINYYCAVNAVVGAITWLPVTGTTQLSDVFKSQGKRRIHYKVIPSKAYDVVPAMNQQWRFCCTCCTAHCIRLAHCLSSAWCMRNNRSRCFVHAASVFLSCFCCSAALLLCMLP